MKKLDFLTKLKQEKKLELVQTSQEISLAYKIKADNCLKSAKVILKEKLYENSITNSYYAMYNSVLSLLFQCGIKCENHTAAMILLERIFELPELKRILEKAKTERIDKQYYIEEENNIELTEQSAFEILKDSENFILNIRSFQARLKQQEIEIIRGKFKLI